MSLVFLSLSLSLSLSSPSRHLTLCSLPLSLFPYAHIYLISLCSVYSLKSFPKLCPSLLFLSFPPITPSRCLGGLRLVSLKPIDQFNGETYVCVFFCHYSLMLNGGSGNRGLLEDGSVCQRWMSDAIWYRVLLTSHRQTVGYIVKPYSH